MKSRLLFALLITLAISAGAQEKSSAENTNVARAISPRQDANNTAAEPRQTQVPVQSRDAKGSQRSGGTGEGTIVVNVWASQDAEDQEEAKDNKLSRGFAVAALNAATRLQFTERRIANAIKTGIPIGEFWIQSDLDAIDDSIRLASLSATNESDRQALQQTKSQARDLRDWCDWLIEENRHLHLANYYTSPARLDNDDRFQSAVNCTRFLISEFASAKLEENSSCR